MKSQEQLEQEWKAIKQECLRSGKCHRPLGPVPDFCVQETCEKYTSFGGEIKETPVYSIGWKYCEMETCERLERCAD